MEVNHSHWYRASYPSYVEALRNMPEGQARDAVFNILNNLWQTLHMAAEGDLDSAKEMYMYSRQLFSEGLGANLDGEAYPEDTERFRFINPNPFAAMWNNNVNVDVNRDDEGYSEMDGGRRRRRSKRRVSKKRKTSKRRRTTRKH